LGDDVREALADEPRSGRRVTIAPVSRLQISAIACDPLPDGEGLSGWTLDLLAEDMALRGFAKISRSSVHRILKENDIKPHRHKGWLHSPDPRFVEKVKEIVPLYLECPPGSVVVSFDEKTGIQAVERKHPDRPAGPIDRGAAGAHIGVHRAPECSRLKTVPVEVFRVLLAIGPDDRCTQVQDAA
jgi:hypothetical protein